jgi:hypothetical protein
MDEGVIRDPKSGVRLAWSEKNALRCEGSGPFEILSGAIDLVPSYEPSPSHSHPPDAFVRSVA